MPGGARGRRAQLVALPAALIILALSACDEVSTAPGGTAPAPPLALEAFYYDRAVHLSWELASGWNEEPFRVYGKREADPDYFLIAEVSSCADGLCSYVDRNVQPNITYQYFVSAVDPRTGRETDSDHAVEVFVPDPVPPPVPGGVQGVGLDGAAYVQWDDRARGADDFSFYRVYLEEPDGTVFLLGETDSEGFLDLLAENGATYRYFVTSVDDQGHESDGSPGADVTPRPDYHGELLFAHEDQPDASGFRFPPSEEVDPVMGGDDPDRDFRVERDDEGMWLVPGPGIEVHQEAYFTSALRCGPAADFDCVDLPEAPAGNYASQDVLLEPSHTYVVRYPAGNGEWGYGAVRVTHLGATQDGAVVIFDWAHQLQPGNRALMPGGGGTILGPTDIR